MNRTTLDSLTRSTLLLFSDGRYPLKTFCRPNKDPDSSWSRARAPLNHPRVLKSPGSRDRRTRWSASGSHLPGPEQVEAAAGQVMAHHLGTSEQQIAATDFCSLRPQQSIASEDAGPQCLQSNSCFARSWKASLKFKE